MSLWLIYLADVVDILFDVVDILDTLWLIYLAVVVDILVLGFFGNFWYSIKNDVGSE